MPVLVKKRIAPRKPLGDEVYEAIKEAILNGELAPGRRLIEEQLAESLGASRTPVRQAMHILEREGLIEKQGRGGYTVRMLSVEDIEEILDLRCVLESFAARLAAEKITPAAVRLLTDHNEAFGRAMKEGDVQRLARLNTEFHDTLYNLADNRRLKRLIEELRDHFYRYRLVLLGLNDMPAASYLDHKAMIEAMTAGWPDRAEALVRDHILKGKEAILEEIRSGRLGGAD